ncbi:uncharacterized protein RHIMIDRAFT_120980 [Rhizopus microsporus ATCC 52813]|uniref:Transposase n=1 Tax=Rhizopus microsporus ATCC 52813 TaxID=1340429 RepID=A0A2G4SXH6_RHIZD|nr:uncharacterized protein RHIMIDRAFT_120980 [Rhizopus microsporus ATCC 52813]PHZ13508.1 hypothetical protein RHIMIDRAFT_120980 [Rhizopus microsporus ATCC 52813]
MKKKSHSILDCKACNILWNRDANASRNMLDISWAICRGKERPSVFTRKAAVEITVPFNRV